MLYLEICVPWKGGTSALSTVLKQYPHLSYESIRFKPRGYCGRNGSFSLNATGNPWRLLIAIFVWLCRRACRPRVDGSRTTTMSCRRCSRTRCPRRCGTGWRPRSPASWRRSAAAPTRSPSSAPWRTPSGRASSSTGSTGGCLRRRSCSFHRKSLLYSRYIQLPYSAY